MPEVTFRLQSPNGTGIRNAMLLAAYPNRTCRVGSTDATGERRFDLYRTDQEMMVLAGAAGHRPLHEQVTPGANEKITLTMEPSSGRNSVLFPSSTGYIPGIEGRLNPINDGRTYVYADNIAINGGPAHPATFEIDEVLHLIDVNGMQTDIRFLVVTSRFSLIEYSDPRPWGS